MPAFNAHNLIRWRVPQGNSCPILRPASFLCRSIGLLGSHMGRTTLYPFAAQQNLLNHASYTIYTLSILPRKALSNPPARLASPPTSCFRAFTLSGHAGSRSPAKHELCSLSLNISHSADLSDSDANGRRSQFWQIRLMC